ncbi:hypothetical protein EDD17DRAFT_1514451 [Pisolithus thermaeus]|nr:hypothetical protein EV401DRAFT_1895546 [Pisolithus croceorrhizus]KAI6147574.1 hypothetical protein EDD17DRAFT_1514451 [Pisolithus thermaeus]
MSSQMQLYEYMMLACTARRPSERARTANARLNLDQHNVTTSLRFPMISGADNYGGTRCPGEMALYAKVEALDFTPSRTVEKTFTTPLTANSRRTLQSNRMQEVIITPSHRLSRSSSLPPPCPLSTFSTVHERLALAATACNVLISNPATAYDIIVDLSSRGDEVALVGQHRHYSTEAPTNQLYLKAMVSTIAKIPQVVLETFTKSDHYHNSLFRSKNARVVPLASLASTPPKQSNDSFCLTPDIPDTRLFDWISDSQGTEN